MPNGPKVSISQAHHPTRISLVSQANGPHGWKWSNLAIHSLAFISCPLQSASDHPCNCNFFGLTNQRVRAVEVNERSKRTPSGLPYIVCPIYLIFSKSIFQHLL
eukprot:TRINITY_DN17902_c0_g1_i1.p1 TRINITY_DN17902_c0_g1~~TRINITY_DN17902_c0_g1_i1.p1  ORF type:complete len:104 (+),score=0.49 TRINITY_DN17902_c0_g1_i1:327-638(+)